MENINMHYLSALVESHLPFKDYYDEHTINDYEYSELVLNHENSINTTYNTNIEINN